MDIEYIQNLTQKIDILLESYQKLCQENAHLKRELEDKNAMILRLQDELNLLNKERDTVKERISAIISRIEQVEASASNSEDMQQGIEANDMGSSQEEF